MPDLWLPGIQRLDCSANGLGLGYGNDEDAYHTWHTFEGIPKDYNYQAMTGARYLASTLKLATFVYNPVLGGIVQLLPMNKAARTLKAGRGGGYFNTETNCRGRVHAQTEVLANAARPWTLDLTRAGLDDLTLLMNFLRSWDVPDRWAWDDMSRPAATYAESNRPGYRTWPTRSGHTVHSRWPHNSHWDPGAIAPPWTLTAQKPVPPPEIQPDAKVRAFQGLIDKHGVTIKVDGLYGSNTLAAAKITAELTGYTGDVEDVAKYTTHLEDHMSQILDAIKAARRESNARFDAIDAELETLGVNTRRLTLSDDDRATLGTSLKTITPAGMAKVGAVRAAQTRKLLLAVTAEEKAHVTAEADRAIAEITAEEAV